MASLLSFCALLALAGTVYCGLVILYRAKFHPLRAVPGPFWAAVTELYALRYHVIEGGTLSSKIQRLHEQYGPIVRIAPNEVHIADHTFHDKLFNFQPELHKPSYHIDNLQFTSDTTLHKQRRRAIDAHFSRSAVQKLEDNIHFHVEKLTARIETLRQSETPANFAVLYRALSADIICNYALRESYNFLDDLETSRKFFAENASFFGALYFFRDIAVCAWVLRIMQRLPPQWMAGNDGQLGVVEFQMRVADTIQRINNRAGEDKINGADSVLQAWMRSPLSQRDKTAHAQLELAMLLVSAGFETSGNTLATAHFHLLDKPETVQRLKSAIAEVWPEDRVDIPRWNELEKIPYLRAVVLEGLRLSLAAIGRLSRVNKVKAMQYGCYNLPAGTIISMSHSFINFDPVLFPDPQKFHPERWLQGERSKELQLKFWPFSKGQRACLGIHLAHAEMYIALATIFRRFDMKLYNTSRVDVDPKTDHFVPAPATTKGVRAMIMK